jgi:hypothetical protein
LNRAIPGTNGSKKFIRRNISNIRNFENIKKIRVLDRDENQYSVSPQGQHHERHTPMTANVHQRNKTAFVFFKRNNKSSSSRRFNENGLSNLVKQGKISLKFSLLKLG